MTISARPPGQEQLCPVQLFHPDADTTVSLPAQCSTSITSAPTVVSSAHIHTHTYPHIPHLLLPCAGDCRCITHRRTAQACQHPDWLMAAEKGPGRTHAQSVPCLWRQHRSAPTCHAAALQPAMLQPTMLQPACCSLPCRLHVLPPAMPPACAAACHAAACRARSCRAAGCLQPAELLSHSC